MVSFSRLSISTHYNSFSVPCTEDIDKKDLKYIIKRGAVICKENSKHQNEKNLEITYTEISNISKTNIII